MSDFVALKDLAEGTKVTYEFGDFSFSTGAIRFYEVPLVVGPRTKMKDRIRRDGTLIREGSPAVMMFNPNGKFYDKLLLDTHVKLR